MNVFVAFRKPAPGAIGLNVGAAVGVDEEASGGGGGGFQEGSAGGGGGGWAGGAPGALGKFDEPVAFDHSPALALLFVIEEDPTFLKPPPAGLKPETFGLSVLDDAAEFGLLWPTVGLTESPTEMPIFRISFSSRFRSRSLRFSASPEFALAGKEKVGSLSAMLTGCE